MKKIIIILFLGTTLLSFGQNENRQKKMDEDFSSEQKAILKTKKMALAFDLNETQQGQILELNKKWVEERASKNTAYKSMNKEALTSDQKFDMMNKVLDTKLAHQEQIKKILNKDQYELWKDASRKMHYRSRNKENQGHRKGRNS